MSNSNANAAGEEQQVLLPHPLPVTGESDEAPMVEAIPPPLLPGRILASWEKRFVRECVKVIVLLSTIYGFDDTGYSTRATVSHWMLLASHYDNAMKFVKNKLASFYSAWKDQRLPTAPSAISEHDNPKVLLGGRAYRWLVMLSRDRESDLWESLLTSILYSKKGMPRPGDELLLAAEISTFRVLTTAKQPKAISLIKWTDAEYYPDSVPITLDRDFVRTQLRRVVKEVYEGQEMTREDWIRPLFPSTSANYINSRAKGGAVGVVMKHPRLLEGLKSPEKLLKVELAGTARSLRPVVDVEPLYEKFEILYDRIMTEAVAEEPTAVPLALPESLKVRVITKGPPLMATALKPLQKFLWRTLKRHPCASLIGQPVTARFVQDRMGKALRPDQGFLSVDYEAATDNLESWVSNEIADAICDELQMDARDPRIRELFKRSLTGHLLVDPSPQADDVDGFRLAQQLNGQLMGSITSFPVLCLANLAACRSALEIDLRRPLTLRDANLCVNGDDALMKCTKVGVDAWEKISDFFGLKPSVGKVYYARDFCNINSTTFKFSDVYPFVQEKVLRKSKDGSFDEVLRPLYFKRVDYVNLGLLKGLKRSGGAMEERDLVLEIGGIGARARDLIDSCPEFLRERVMTSFLSHHKELLRDARVPWFLPERFGGLGLPSVGRWKPDNRELRLARVVLDTGMKIPKKPISAPWKVWQYATQRYDQEMKGMPTVFPYHLYEHMSSVPDGLPVVHSLWKKGTSNGDHFYGGNGSLSATTTGYLAGPSSEMTIKGLLCVEALFRVRGIKSIYEEKTEGKGYLNQLRGMWKKLRQGTYPEPLNFDNLPPVLDFSDLNLITSRKAELPGYLVTHVGNDDISQLVSLFASTQLSQQERTLDS